MCRPLVSWEDAPREIVFVVGKVCPGTLVSEADVMRAIAVEKCGLSADEVILENKASPMGGHSMHRPAITALFVDVCIRRSTRLKTLYTLPICCARRKM